MGSDGAFVCRVGSVHLVRLNRIDSPCLAVMRALISLSPRRNELEMLVINDETTLNHYCNAPT